MLAVAGGLSGILLAGWIIDLIMGLKPPGDIPITIELHVDWRVLVFSMIVSVMTGVLFGLVPALQATKPDLIPALKDIASQSGMRRSWLRNTLVVAQIAVSLLLLVAAGLTLRALQQLRSMNPGFTPENAVEMSFDLSLQGYQTDNGTQLRKQILSRIEALPGVQAATVTDFMPLSMNYNSTNILIEGAPGLAKTRAVKLFADLVSADFVRIQATPDLLPSDLTGTTVFRPETGSFDFVEGPLFSNIVLVDEINRATPRTQSSLLEAMEEGQVSTEGRSLPLPTPFFVIATQNPVDQIGTFALPESQLDRFLMRITLGYPDRASERSLLQGEDRRHLAMRLQPVMRPSELERAQQEVLAVRASEPLLDYLQALIAATRSGRWFVEGLSPRAGIALLRAAKARALINQRDYVAPDDVQSVLPQTVAHRLVPVAGGGRGRVEQVRAMIDAVPVP